MCFNVGTTGCGRVADTLGFGASGTEMQLQTHFEENAIQP